MTAARARKPRRWTFRSANDFERVITARNKDVDEVSGKEKTDVGMVVWTLHVALSKDNLTSVAIQGFQGSSVTLDG